MVRMRVDRTPAALRRNAVRHARGVGALGLALVALGPGAMIHGPHRMGRERVIIRLVDPTPRARFLLEATAAPLTLEARHEVVVEGLQEIHARALQTVALALEEARAAGALVEIDRLWLVNAVVAEVDPDWIARLEADPAIAAVLPDARLTPGTLPPGGDREAETHAPADPTPELQQIRVPEVWAQGNTGQGAIVANVDTGVNGEDDTLEDGWRGRFAGADAAWFSPIELTVFPVDDDQALANGHGTATMGILAGGEASFGVAYDATWISGDLFRSAGGAAEGYISTALQILEWLSDPDGDPTTASDVPDVVSNSYGLSVTNAQTPCDPIFNDAIDALEAAGAIVVWSAGNETRPANMAGTVTIPANRADSPVNAFAVGAVDDANQALPSSGRGPSPCGGTHATKPEVVAPGQGILTRNRFNQFTNLSGTSFSTPMVAGVLALMRSKNPTITPEAAKTILLETALDLGATGDDNASGHGLTDAVAALGRVARPSQPIARLVGFRPAGASSKLDLTPAQVETTLVLRPGQVHDLVPVLTNHGPAIPTSTANLSSPTSGVRITRPAIPLTAAETGAFFGPAQGESFGVELDPAVTTGSDVVLVLSVQGAPIGPFEMVIKAGEPVAGTFATHDRGRVRLSVTNFGALGYYTGSHLGGFALRGQGFRFPPTSPNWLFHASLMAGTAGDRFSDNIPYGEDTQSASDFFPVYGAPITADEAAGGQRIVAAYDDRHAPRPLDLRVRQESFAFGDAGATDFVLVQYIVTNLGSQTLGGLRLGLFADWDLPDPSNEPAETAGWEPDLLLGFVQGISVQPLLGVVWLDDAEPGLVTYAVLRRDSIGQSARQLASGIIPAEAFEDGREFSDVEKWDALLSGQSRTADSRPGDLWQVLGAGPIALAAGGTDTVAVGLVAGDTRASLRQAAIAARDAYFRRVLGREPPPPPPPPEAVVLRQNFPNPFRVGQPTTIRFAIPDTASGLRSAPAIDLAVYDVAGRRVRTLTRGQLVAGEQAVVWDGTDDSGASAPAGVYVVRLLAGGREETIRVLLVP